MYKPTTINRYVKNEVEAREICEAEGYGFQGMQMLSPNYAKLHVIPLYQNQVPGCQGCITNKERGYGPMHYPSRGCESGKRPHCTCDGCF